jgi:TnpA family transposase
MTAHAAVLADATNLGLGRMAAANRAPNRGTWDDGPTGTTSSSDWQFFRSAKRGDAAGDVNARYGQRPGPGFYTQVSYQHGP